MAFFKFMAKGKYINFMAALVLKTSLNARPDGSLRRVP